MSNTCKWREAMETVICAGSRGLIPGHAGSGGAGVHRLVHVETMLYHSATREAPFTKLTFLKKTDLDK